MAPTNSSSTNLTPTNSLPTNTDTTNSTPILGRVDPFFNRKNMHDNKDAAMRMDNRLEQTEIESKIITINKIKLLHEIMANDCPFTLIDYVHHMYECIRQCLQIAVEHKNSSLLVCFPTSYSRKSLSPLNDYLSDHAYKTMIKNILKYAIKKHAYYIVHILLTRYSPRKFIMEHLFELNIYPEWFESRVDLFMFHYLLKQNTVNFKTEQSAFEPVLRQPEQFLYYWLLCCYDTNNKGYISYMDFGNRCQNPSLVNMVISTLCKLGTLQWLFQHDASKISVIIVISQL